jgi:hypothetical protein
MAILLNDLVYLISVNDFVGQISCLGILFCFLGIACYNMSLVLFLDSFCTWDFMNFERGC